MEGKYSLRAPSEPIVTAKEIMSFVLQFIILIFLRLTVDGSMLSVVYCLWSAASSAVCSLSVQGVRRLHTHPHEGEDEGRAIPH
jgi:hypothetical protein